jgi:hypothetical protein
MAVLIEMTLEELVPFGKISTPGPLLHLVVKGETTKGAPLDYHTVRCGL